MELTAVSTFAPSKASARATTPDRPFHVVTGGAIWALRETSKSAIDLAQRASRREATGGAQRAVGVWRVLYRGRTDQVVAEIIGGLRTDDGSWVLPDDARVVSVEAEPRRAVRVPRPVVYVDLVIPGEGPRRALVTWNGTW